jgi:hypothetical protein
MAGKVFYSGAILTPNAMKECRKKLSEAQAEFIKEYSEDFQKSDMDIKGKFSEMKQSSIGGGHNQEQLNHHCTHIPGAPTLEEEKIQSLGEFPLTIDGFGVSDDGSVAAWRVRNPPFTVKAATPHITALLGPTGKVFKAGDITKWIDIQPFTAEATFEIVDEDYAKKHPMEKIAARIAFHR